jgi:6-pyruvoyltetrahydropterin/6-carboxytetrahydropterin synthase
MAYYLEKEFRFEAAHRLPNHDGKCARLHGHSWRGRIIVKGEALAFAGPKAGMLIDYAAISAAIKPLVEERLDHHYLNESLKLDNPTSELIAKYVFDYVNEALGGIVSAVVIEETCTSRCTYSPSPERLND